MAVHAWANRAQVQVFQENTLHAEGSRSLVFKFSSFQENSLHAERSSSLVFHFMKKDVSHFLNCSESDESGSHSLHLEYSFIIVVCDDGNDDDLENDKGEDDEHDHSDCENDVDFDGFVFENGGSLAIMVAPFFVVLLPSWCCRGQHTRLRCLFALKLSPSRQYVVDVQITIKPSTKVARLLSWATITSMN